VAISERLALLIDINGASAVAEMNKVGAAAERELGKAEDRTQRMGTKFQQVGVGMMATAATIGAGLYAAGQSAADLEQAVGGTEAVFAGSSKALDAWAKSADTSAGLSEEAARRLTTQIGGALQGLGFAQEEAAQKSIELTQIGADLAATYGGTTVDSVQALGSALRGEFDPMEQFNVFLKQSEIDAKAVELGLAETTTEVDKNARAQATLAMITEQSGAAQGQFARESETVSGKMAIAAAETENAKAAIGAGFMPVMAQVSGVLGGAATKFSEFNEETGGAAASVLTYGTLALGAVGALSTLVGTVIKAKTAIVDAAASGREFVSGLRTMPGAIQAISFAGAAAGLYLFTQKMQENRAEADKWAGQFGSSGTIPEQIGETEKALNEARAASEAYASVDVFGASIWGSNEGRIQADKVDALQRKLDDLKASEEAAGNAAELNARGVDSMGNSIEEATDPAADLASAIEETEKAFNEAAEAADRFWNPAFDLSEMERAASQAHKDLTDSLLENGVTLDLNTEAGRNNRAQFEESAKAAVDYGLKILETGGSVDEATAATNGHIEGLRNQMLQAGFTQGQVDLYVAALKLTPEQVATQFLTPGLADAYNNAEALRLKMLEIHNTVIAPRVFFGMGGDGMNGGRAAGGAYMPGGIHPIGEDGDEIIDTGRGKYLVGGQRGGNVRPMSNADRWVTYEDGSTGLQRTDENGNWRGVPRSQDPGAYDMKAAMDFAAMMQGGGKTSSGVSWTAGVQSPKREGAIDVTLMIDSQVLTRVLVPAINEYHGGSN
jgi:hypothetical protein